MPDSSPRLGAVDDKITICLHGNPGFPVSGSQAFSRPQEGIASSIGVIATVTSTKAVTACHGYTDENCHNS